MGRRAVVIISNILMISAVFLFFYFVIALVEQSLLSRLVVVKEGLIEEWLARFERLNTGVLIAALLSSLAWCALTGLVWKVNKWQNSNRRLIWVLFMILPAIGSCVAMFLTPQTEYGKHFAYFFYFLNGIAAYYFMTCLGTPSAFKYNPWGARGVRLLNISEW
jgi:hypothetical protein